MKSLFQSTYNEYTDYGIGDDCANLHINKNNVLITTDILVDGIHFKTDWSTAEEIAKRAFWQNCADISASGAKVCAFVISIVLPDQYMQCSDWLFRFCESLKEVSIENGASIIGGDISGGKELCINITMFGEIVEKHITRDNASINDIVAVCGEIGYSLTGYKLLKSGKIEGLDEFEALCISRFKVPSPPIESALIAAKSGATAMMDISDGLMKDLARLADASDVSIKLKSLEKIKDPRISIENFYLSGEDHGFIATFPNKSKVPSNFQIIGECVKKQDQKVILTDKINVNTLKKGIWEHF